MIYKLVTWSFFVYFKLFYKLEIRGRENVPKEGAVVLCPNHISNLDPPLVAGCTTSIRKIHFMAKSELFKNKFFGYILDKLGAYPIERGKADRKALKKTNEILQEGKCLGIFPEGTRSKTGDLQGASSGAAMFSLKNNAVIIPVAITGEYKKFKPLTITYGEPLNVDEYRKDKVSSNDVKEVTYILMNEIERLIKKG